VVIKPLLWAEAMAYIPLVVLRLQDSEGSGRYPADKKLTMGKLREAIALNHATPTSRNDCLLPRESPGDGWK
jgi:hypothetical protein